MTNNFSPASSRILKQSKEEARRLKSDIVTPAHLLLALLRLAPETTGTWNVKDGTLSRIISDVEQKAQPVQTTYTTGEGEVAMNEAASRVMRLSVLESRALRSRTVEPVHIMLALLRSGDRETAVVLRDHDVNYDEVRDRVRQATPRATFGLNDSDDDDDEAVPFGAPATPKKKKDKNGNVSDTPCIDNFGTDLSEAARAHLLDPVVGREGEILRVAEILCRRKKNNPILIGEPGVGKSAIVEGLAQRIADHTIARALWDRRVVMLDMGAVVAGTKYRGQFEERIKGIVDELKRHKEIIIFIDEIHTLVGAGSAENSMDAANLLKPALARGEIQCIGATTLEEYHRKIEKDGALERRFQRVLVSATTTEETLTILQNLRPRYEEHHNVKYTPEALTACVRLTEHYVSDRAFPDKAIDAMDEAGAKMHIEDVPVPVEVTQEEEAVKTLTDKKNEAIKAQTFELAADYRDQLLEAEARLKTVRETWEATLREHPKTVTEETVAMVVSQMTGIPAQRIGQEEGLRLRNLGTALQAAVIGQDEAVGQITRAIQRSRLGLKDPRRPIGTFMFVGPTGVGKTYLAQRLAEELFGQRDALIRIDMSEYGEKHTVSRLVGAPPGYVGYEEGGQLTERVRRRPYSIVLLDEIEKAHADVFNILLQMMDEGRLTDGNGDTISFRNTVIILTSNSGTRELKEFGGGVGFARNADAVDPEEAKRIVRKSLNRRFAPEFINRLDDIVYFRQLTPESIRRIVDIELRPLVRRVEEMGYHLEVTPEARALIGRRGYDAQYGARPLKRALQTMVEDRLAELLMSDHAPQSGDTITAVADGDAVTLQ